MLALSIILKSQSACFAISKLDYGEKTVATKKGMQVETAM